MKTIRIQSVCRETVLRFNFFSLVVYQNSKFMCMGENVAFSFKFVTILFSVSQWCILVWKLGSVSCMVYLINVFWFVVNCLQNDIKCTRRILEDIALYSLAMAALFFFSRFFSYSVFFSSTLNIHKNHFMLLNQNFFCVCLKFPCF